MSLINDALKRAKQSQEKNPPPGGPALLPVEPHPPGALAWMLPVAVIILIVAACFVIGLATARHTVTAIVNAPQPVATQTVAAAAAPFVPPPAPVVETNAEAVAAPEMPKLQGIVLDPQRPWAIVSGQTVYVGDKVGEFRVKAISKFTVTLTGADGRPKIIGIGN